MVKSHQGFQRAAAALIVVAFAIVGSAPALARTADRTTSSTQVTHQRITHTVRIPNRTVVHRTAQLPRGETRVGQPGHTGLRVNVFRLTLEGGDVVDRQLVNTWIRREPAPRIILKGTGQAQQPTRRCDPNYTGCVPIASDVDCAGGSGNGPAYVRGPVRIIGTDIYDLDADGDGWGCE